MVRTESGQGDASKYARDAARAEMTVTGRVQGVGFRGFAQRHAMALGLCGWIKNRYDGAVEVVAEGERYRIERFIALLREGPPWARVDGVEVRWCEYHGEFSSFRVRG
ncbi:MAG: acylphosphatase [Betaproteobacteria bacterium]